MFRQSILLVVFFVTLTAFVMTLTACAPFKPDSTKAGMCNELNSRIIFTGGTSNIQQAEVQQAQEGLAQRMYDKGCE